MHWINVIKITPSSYSVKQGASGCLVFWAVVEILTATLPLFKQVSSSHFPLYGSLSTALWQHLHKPFSLNPDLHIQLCLAGWSQNRQSGLLSNEIK